MDEEKITKNEVQLMIQDAVNKLNEKIMIKNVEQDTRINNLVYISETQSKDLKELIDFMKTQQNKPNMWMDKIIWIVIGALPGVIASFFKK